MTLNNRARRWCCVIVAAGATSCLLSALSSLIPSYKNSELPTFTTIYFNLSLGLPPFSEDQWEIKDFEATEERLQRDSRLLDFCNGLKRRLETNNIELDPLREKVDVWATGVRSPSYGWPFPVYREYIDVSIERTPKDEGVGTVDVLQCTTDGKAPMRYLVLQLRIVRFSR